MFLEYQRRCNYFIDLGCRNPILSNQFNFSVERELVCLKRHFAEFYYYFFFYRLSPVKILLSIFSILIEGIHFFTLVSILHFRHMLCFLLNKSGLYYIHPQELLNQPPTLLCLPYCLRLLELDHLAYPAAQSES